jgi:hypothetical protein
LFTNIISTKVLNIHPLFKSLQSLLMFLFLQGNHRSVTLALSILCEAIELYKELCEGKYCGKHVDRCQYIRGVEFIYSPPPRSAVPYAAALKPDSTISSPASDADGASNGTAAGGSLFGSPINGLYAAHGSSHSPLKVYVSPTSQQDNQSIHAIHSLTGSGLTLATAAGTSADLPLDPGMVAALEAAAEFYMSANTAIPMGTDTDLPSLPAELRSCAASGTTATTAAPALVAALAGPSAVSLLTQSGNMNSMAPETPLVPYKLYDNPAACVDTFMGNNISIVATASAVAAPTPHNSVQLPTVDFFKMFENNQNPTFAANNPVNMPSHQQSIQAPLSQFEIQAQQQPQPEPVKNEVPCYSLFGPDGNVFGPSLLRDIWGPDGNGPGLPPIPSWRGNAPVAVSDDQLNMIGLPSYEDFAEKVKSN